MLEAIIIFFITKLHGQNGICQRIVLLLRLNLFITKEILQKSKKRGINFD